MLRGRDEETARIDAVLAAARSGRSGALVLRGEAGIGKSALLDHAERAAADAGTRVLRGAGVESESDLPYAGLHLLLGRAIEHVDALPAPQARALRGALGLADSASPSRFLVGLAVLTLLAELAASGPVLCLVDDAHWLDRESAEALLFATRRLEAEGVAVLLAVREPHAPLLSTPHIDELRLRRLPRADAEALLQEHAADLPRQVRGQVLAEAAGNPLALLTLTAVQRDGYSSTRLGVPGRIQDTFADQIAALPEGTRALLLVAAADDSADAATVLRAARELDARPNDLGPAERRGLLRVAENRVEFAHPLIRAAAYEHASSGDRAAAHRALAGVYADRPEAADRRAWHLAAATPTTDEEVAVLLESAAERARARGGLSAIATAYERAAALSPDPADRRRRTIAAAEAAAYAGDPGRAADLLGGVTGTDDTGQRVTVARLHSMLAAAEGRADTSYRVLFAAAVETEAEEGPPVTPGTAGATKPDGTPGTHRTPGTRGATGTARTPGSHAGAVEGSLAAESGKLLLEAVRAAWVANDFDCVARIGDHAARHPGGAPAHTLARAALATNQLDQGHTAEGVAALRASLDGHDALASPTLNDRVLYARLHLIAGDFDAAHRAAVDLEAECRAQGALAVLPQVQVVLARTQFFLGRHRDARATVEDGLRTAADSCQPTSRAELAALGAELAAVRGDAERCRTLVAEPLELGVAPASVHAAVALSLLDLGQGRPEEALVRLESVVEGTRPMGIVGNLPLLVEAAFRLGRTDRAADAADRYTAWATAVDRPWARSLALRCRALLDGSEDAYRAALALDASPFDQARTRLLFGEWLRRARRTTEAREQLHLAADAFRRWGARPWEDRAGAELRATGETRATDTLARDRSEDPLDRLTPQELQVVRLAATGLTNRDIGAQLFLSPRTVGHHLYKAYPKLGVASRAELGALGLHRDRERRRSDGETAEAPVG
ncbi:helix-turn-helix transcriptional regulator [Nocardiopsis aegyptia]|uniref:DNA-binding CsgD family transcriptional regulator n=1 Tax=Nocardiopsis aegyptia TaxID=220378 RepID=A0A7Z0EMF1_9ACTN|nr:helix-turn-helix transcriptional regulator [Nocardiopsis aegyptia]NYJ34808.1 DNA-binding CsgD family transcriptional regulator [Nocardiopsis aegyptia]